MKVPNGFTGAPGLSISQGGGGGGPLAGPHPPKRGWMDLTPAKPPRNGREATRTPNLRNAEENGFWNRRDEGVRARRPEFRDIFSSPF